MDNGGFLKIKSHTSKYLLQKQNNITQKTKFFNKRFANQN